VLVVEDDRNLLSALRYNLSAEGYTVDTSSDGAHALKQARELAPDLIVLDLMLPTMGGIEVCRTLRREGSVVPILVLTARDTEVDRVVGLEVGADDYVTKPFSVREFLARVSALLRRVEMLKAGGAAPAGERISAGALEIDVPSRSVRLNGAAISLRPREFELLAYLAARPGRVLTREQLLEEVWGFDYIGDTRTVDVHVRWLRMKIEEDPANPVRLQTVRGVGYRFEA
jgi:two-component system alkaline phosphatase synthesis response regulator PhoP